MTSFSDRSRQTLQRTLTISIVGLVVGLATAFATIGFIEIVAGLNRLLLVDPAARIGQDALTLVLTTVGALTLGGLVVGLILYFGGNDGAQLGPADTIYAVQLKERLPPPSAGAWSTLAAMLSLGCGASVGQYGPLVYLGTLFGQLGNRLPLGLRDIRNIAIACGVAAAISTGFNAPIAALVFTHEVILRHYSLRMFTAVTIASACGYIVADVIFDYPPLFLIEFDGRLYGLEFPLFALEGLACGLLALVFLRLLHRATQLAREISLPAVLKPMLAGFVTALIALQVPEVLGAGQDVLRQASQSGNFGADTLLVILLTKLLVTVICIGFGFAGGVIFPTLLIGVLFGALFAQWVPALLLSEWSGLPVYALCGMVALMSPVIGAPMTAVLLVFEFTHNYEITIAAMLAVVFANLVAAPWYSRSQYDYQLAERGVDLSQGRERAYLMHRQVGDYLRQTLPVIEDSVSMAELQQALDRADTGTAVIVDEHGRYLGLAYQHQLGASDDTDPVASLELDRGRVFDERTSLWQAMHAMRDYVGEAVPVIDSGSGRYLGALPEAVVIGAFLDASQELRREAHEV